MLLKQDADTIVALSTGLPPSGIAVVRFSGPSAHQFAVAFGAVDLKPRRAGRRTLLSPSDGCRLDDALCLRFDGPASATGEDVAELHLHGGPALVARVLQDAVALGARVAEPGEFTLRGVLNGQMSLPDAEALAELIEARTEGERRRASRLASGALGRQVADWRERLIGAMAYTEAHLDFSDEGDVMPDDRTLNEPIASLQLEIEDALATSREAHKLTDGYRIALVGAPNAGKSSLINALAQRNVALVSEEAGTTRDAIEVTLELNGYRATVTDTAGLRDGVGGVEALGIARSREVMAGADLVLEVVSPDTVRALEGADWVVAHKVDLAPPGWCPEAFAHTSVRDPETITAFAERLATRVTAGLQQAEAALLTRVRQRDALASVSRALWTALEASALELKAEALREAAVGMARLTGEIGIEDVLDDVFGRFCIGK